MPARRMNWGMGLALGMGSGISLGVVLDNVALGAPLGLAMSIFWAGIFASTPDDPNVSSKREDANPKNPPISSTSTTGRGAGDSQGGEE